MTGQRAIRYVEKGWKPRKIAAVKCPEWNPHLTLTLSPPIEWERRGNSQRTSIVVVIP
jgi:hypothetical protein